MKDPLLGDQFQIQTEAGEPLMFIRQELPDDMKRSTLLLGIGLAILVVLLVYTFIPDHETTAPAAALLLGGIAFAGPFTWKLSQTAQDFFTDASMTQHVFRAQRVSGPVSLFFERYAIETSSGDRLAVVKKTPFRWMIESPGNPQRLDFQIALFRPGHVDLRVNGSPEILGQITLLSPQELLLDLSSDAERKVDGLIAILSTGLLIDSQIRLGASSHDRPT